MSGQPSFHQDFFKLPEGASLVRGIFTTMSVDLEELIRMAGMCLIPGCSALGSIDLPALHMMAAKNRLRFFYDGKDPFNLRCALPGGSCFRDLAIPVISGAPCFHPKIILLEYETGSERHCFRLLVSSKNLTVARSFETGVWLESVPHQGDGPLNHNLPALAEFLRNNTSSSDGKDFLEGVDDALKAVDFVLWEDRDDPGRRNRVTVKVSGPGELGQQDALVDRLLDGENWKSLGKEDMVILSPDYETSSEAPEKLFIVKPVDRPTHGKLYYDRKEKILWTGSANCSESGLTKNVECMVEVREAADVWVDTGAETGELFGVPCVRYTETIQMGVSELEKALQDFLENHKIEIDESYDGNERRSVKIKVDLQGQRGSDQGITIKLLPLGMAETKSETNDAGEKWKEFPGKDSRNPEHWKGQFTGAKKEPLTHALRIKAEKDSQTCEVIYWDPNWQSSKEEEKENVFQTFTNTSWLSQYCQTQKDGEEAVEALHRQITAVAEALLRDEEEGSARCKRIKQIEAASKLYRSHFSGRKEGE